MIMLLMFLSTTYGGQQEEFVYAPDNIIFQGTRGSNEFKSLNSIKHPGHYTTRDWGTAIDSFWGSGLPTQTKLQIFDQFWSLIDSSFACFNNLIVNWDSLRVLYRTEIEDTVSRGRFAAIMNYLSLALKESHTHAEDILVNYSTSLAPGVPLFIVSGWYDNGHFGAGLTSLPDSSLLVYQTVANHPLGLTRGDIILGYDRIPWKVLYKQLTAAQLPIYRNDCCWGSSDSTLTHSLLMSAGMNWHLFDTIDVAKYPTWDTIHLSVAPLIGQTMSLYCTEQMDIPGVPKPDIGNNQVVSYGIISGTQIGYIYGWGWWANAQTEFYNAINDLINNPSLKGMIIDFRFNGGGNMFMSNQGLELLFRDTTKTICWSIRDDPHDHFSMVVASPDSYCAIPGNGIGYNKPIAVLTGPGAVSSGDQVAFRMKFHPTAKLFGKSTATAFNTPVIDSIHPDWFVAHAIGEACLASDTLYYLTHRELSIDFPVWLTPISVAQGEDDVVKAAMAWIDTMSVTEDKVNTRLPGFINMQIYPNPIRDNTTFEYTLSSPGKVSIKIYNILGQEIATVLNVDLKTGHYINRWKPESISNGVYFCRVTINNIDKIIKVTIIK